MKYYVENQDEKLPPVARFSYGQKLFFWLMLWGAILLLLSGGRAVPIVDELATLPLNFWAREHHYVKVQANMLGI